MKKGYSFVKSDGKVTGKVVKFVNTVRRIIFYNILSVRNDGMTKYNEFNKSKSTLYRLLFLK